MLDFLYTAVSWVLLRWHQLFTAIGLDSAGGLNWALSIIFLVVTARLLLFRLFIKQVHYQRAMQDIQPEIQKIRDKYKNDRAEMQRQMMTLQQERGFNPLAGCLPMFLQIPVFIGLFHSLRHLANSAGLCDGTAAQRASANLHLYSFTTQQTCDAAKAKLFGAPLAGSLRDLVTGHGARILELGGERTSTLIVTIMLVLISSGATFLTQLLVASRATTVPTGTAATVQRMMKVFIPASVLVSGVWFPLGVLLYWFTSNLWTLLQQMYINKYHPPEQKAVAEVGVLGKTLAPKPGQRPARDPHGRTVVKGTAGQTSLTKAVETSSDEDATPAPPPARSSTPRPGQRPQRPAGNRPQGKRPSQAKKRR